MKKCFKCGTEKGLDEFYRHSQMQDGRLNKCKECARRDVGDNYRKRKPYYQAYERRRFRRPERKAQIRRIVQRRRKLHPEKYKAHNAVSNAIRDGRLIRQPCEACGNAKSQAHHDDYNKPLDVRWLCFKCHRAYHGQEVNETVALGETA